MAELEGQVDIFQAIAEELEGEPTPARAISILNEAMVMGWVENPVASFVIRLTKDGALPFFARWDMAHNPETGKRSWRFQGARAQNGQPLAFGDIKTYLNDPRVILPEPPDELCEAAEFDDPTQTIRGALGAVAPISAPDPAYINGPPAKPAKPATVDWGAIL